MQIKCIVGIGSVLRHNSVHMPADVTIWRSRGMKKEQNRAENVRSRSISFYHSCGNNDSVLR